MLTYLQEKLLQKKIWVFLFIGLLFVFGINSLNQIAIDAVPDITNVQVLINTKTGGLDPEQVEKTITYKIENEMAGLPQVADVRSLSKFGLSQVVIVFKDGTNIYWARQLVSEKLQAVGGELPQGISPKLGPISTGLGEVFMYAVLPKEGSTLEKKPEKERLLYLRTIHDFVIKPYLKAHIDGIAEVDATGGYQKEIHIDFHPSKLAVNGVTLAEILDKLRSIGNNFGGGYIEKDNQQIVVRTHGEVDLAALKNIPVKLDVFGRSIRIRDLAEVRQDHTQRVGAATYQGKQAVLGTVLMLMGENSRKVAVEAEKALAEVELPSDVKTEVLYTRTYLVNETLKTVAKNLAEGAMLVILVLFLVMGNFRAAIIVALAIPLSMLGAITGMSQFGISANLMSLGAIDFGLLVDGSVVMIENLIRKLENETRTKFSLKDKTQLVLESAKEVNQPVFLGLAIIMIVYIPILSLEGVEGKMFHPMALTVLMALATSLMVALIVMPLLGYIFLHKPRAGSNHKEPFLLRWIHKIYEPALNFTVNQSGLIRGSILGGTGLLLVLALLFFNKLGSDFMPPLNEGDMVINFVHPPEISLTKALERQFLAENEIAKFKEVKHVFSRIGTPESATDPMGVNLVDTFLILQNTNQWPKIDEGRARTKAELYEALEKVLQPIMGEAEVSENQPIAMRFNEILEGSRADVSLRIYGKDLKVLAKMQDKAVEILEKIQGVEEVELDALTALRKSPVLEVQLDYEKMNAYGVHLGEVNETFETAMSGKEVGSYYEYDWRFPIIVKMAENYRDNYHEIGRIPLALPEPGSIPLGAVAKLTQIEDVVAIARGNGKRYAGVAINLADRDTLSFVKEAKSKIETELKLTEGYETVWGGQFKNLERARKKLMVVIPIILGIIFILLYQNFGSIKQTMLIYMGIPFAATGGVFFLFIRGINFSVSASIGFITLAGIAILNGMVLVTFINQLRESGKSLKQAVVEGALTRLRPVIMTALVASLGFLPMALNTGIGAEVQRPLATVVIGGLVSSTILTLLLLPMLYLWLEKKKVD
jgi:cobalt-zinc-cadmium resistance protein CzcA